MVTREQLEKFGVGRKNDLVLKLKRNRYGIKQAGRL